MPTERPRSNDDDTAPDVTDEPRTPGPAGQDGHPSTDGDATPGDLDAPDIVGPFGEEMPVQSHDEPD